MSPASRSAPPRAAVPVRVLLVEDNPGDARLIIEMLRDVSGQFDLDRVDRLEAALELLGHAKVDVVLLDLGLPDSQGLDTFERARRSAGTEPIIVISGLDDEKVALEAVRSGAQDYLVKGRIEGQGLARVIRHAIERQRTDVQLRWLTLAVDQSPASVFITDPKGTIQYVNRKFTAITGYSSTEAIGNTPRLFKSGLTPPEYYQKLWQTILAGETWRSEIQNKRKSGELYWDSVVVSPIRDARGEIAHFLAVQEDITERKRAELTLRERDERFQQLADNIKEVFFIQDAQFRETLYISPAYEKVWGRSCQSLYDDPQSFIKPIPEEDRGPLFASIERTRRGEFAGGVEFRVVRPDGQVRWVLAHAVPVLNEGGAVYRIAGVVSDVTERRRAEEALRESERRARTLFETVNLIVLGVDADGRVNYANPFLLTTMKRTPEEVLGKDWFQFIPASARASQKERFREVLKQGGGYPHTETPILTTVGEERMVAWTSTVIRDTAGHYSGTLNIGEDITERVKLEQQYRQAQKMEAVGRLAGGVAHDFNNLLTVITSYAELMLQDLAAADAHRADLEEIRKAAGIAATLTRQLLAFSRQQVLEPKVLTFNDVVTGAEKMLKRLIGEDVRLVSTLASDAGPVRADAGQLEQVIMNLAVNARDAMPDGGDLTIETANAALTEDYVRAHLGAKPGHYVMLAMSDTGVGMNADVQAHIFEPFFTTKEAGKGTGLGLATVYGIVKQSGGFIWVYSEPGHGTTFKIYLPRVQATVDAAAPAVPPEVRGGTETVLLVEDAPQVRAIARQILERFGYAVLEAPNGEAALGIGARHPGPIHLLLTDVVMPEMNGRQVAERLTALRRDLKVLYMSGYADDAVMRRGVLERGMAYLQKPFTPQALARKVRDVLDG